MKKSKIFGDVIHYLEQISLEGTEIDYDEISKIAMSPAEIFQRIFIFVSGISIADYVRKRKLTLAGHDLKNSDISVLDVAIKYGFESHSAFSRAFKNHHGMTPSEARFKAVQNDYLPINFLDIRFLAGKRSMEELKKIVGDSEIDSVMSNEMDWNDIYKTNTLFWNTVGSDALEAISLPLYGAFISEEKCQLFGKISGKKLLEIGCGSGESLKYLSKQNPSELWGIDISASQLEKANHLLTKCDFLAKFICSPMEEECGIPTNYFDLIYSIYAIGWTTDLDTTFNRIASYLKKDGVFIFSWSHPIHKCVAIEQDRFIFKKCYFDESRYSLSLGERILTMSDYKLSTYINALSKAGFFIEELIEETDEDMTKESSDDFSEKAKMLPVTFVIKASKL